MFPSISRDKRILKELEKMQIKIPYLFSMRNARGAKGFHGSTHVSINVEYQNENFYNNMWIESTNSFKYQTFK